MREIGMLVDAIIYTKAELKKYIYDIGDKLGAMAEGNMNLQVTQDYLGEFKPIKEALTKIIASLNDTLSQINQAADQVAVGSEEISQNIAGSIEAVNGK